VVQDWSTASHRTNSASIRCTATCGNWTEDCYNKRYTVDAPTDGSPWLDGNCSKRVVRGGYWLDLPSRLRSGYRDGVDENGGNGFRVVRTLNLPQ